MKVFTHCINHMRKHLLKDIEEKLAGEITMDDIHFVLTVPAIWDDTAKMFMREAAVDVMLSLFLSLSEKLYHHFIKK